MNEQAADQSEIGLQLLFAGGVGEAMVAAQATLADVQRAVERIGGFAAVQSAGAAVAAVPAATPATAAMETPPDLSQTIAPAAPVAPVVVTTSVPAAEGTLATPQGQTVAPPPLPPAVPEASAPVEVPPPAAPVSLASFAPTSFGQPAPSADYGSDSAWPMPTPGPTERYFATSRDHVYAPMSRTEADDRDDGAASMLRAMAPPPAPSGGGGPTGGDVFLDGARVGTWIADNLAREAGRPQAGGTGFDPRLTASWPGTLQGG